MIYSTSYDIKKLDEDICGRSLGRCAMLDFSGGTHRILTCLHLGPHRDNLELI